jgi:hypothetical protein
MIKYLMILSLEVILVSEVSRVLMWYFCGSLVGDTSFLNPNHFTIGTGRPVYVQESSAIDPTSPDPLVVAIAFGSAEIKKINLWIFNNFPTIFLFQV